MDITDEEFENIIKNLTVRQQKLLRVLKESGELCLMSCIFGENRDIFFPKLTESLHLISFADIAIKNRTSRGNKNI